MLLCLLSSSTWLSPAPHQPGTIEDAANYMGHHGARQASHTADDASNRTPHWSSGSGGGTENQGSRKNQVVCSVCALLFSSDLSTNSLGVTYVGFAGPPFRSDAQNCSSQVGFHPCCLQEVCPGFLFQNARFEIVTVTLALAPFFRKGPV